MKPDFNVSHHALSEDISDGNGIFVCRGNPLRMVSSLSVYFPIPQRLAKTAAQIPQMKATTK
jgi:hypothetical protein